MSPSIWGILELQPTRDVAQIRRAYARKLKVTQPEDDAEGFQRLRAAYEAALRLAKQSSLATVSVLVEQENEAGSAAFAAPADTAESATPAVPAMPAERTETAETAALAEPAESAAPARAATPVASPPERDPALVELEANFRALQAGLQVGHAIPDTELRARLHAVLDSAALDNLSIFHTLETMLAALIAATVPRSDSLIVECVTRFKWLQQEHSLQPNPAVRAVLQRQSELEFRWDLERGRSPYSRAYAQLRKRNSWPVRCWRAYRRPPSQCREVALLALLRDRYPRLLETLDPSEVGWWTQFTSRPRPSYGMARIAWVLTVGAAILGLIAGIGDEAQTLSDGVWKGAKFSAGAALVTAGTFAVLILARLYFIDWPIRLVALRWPYRPPLFAQIGWLPLCLGTLLLVSILPAYAAFTVIAGVLAGAAALWAIYMAGPMPPAIIGSQIHLENSHLVRALLLNLVLAFWWIISLQEWSDLALNQYVVATIGAMCTTEFGNKPLTDSWFGRLTLKQRNFGLVVFAIAACLIGTLVWFTASMRAMQPLVTAVVVAFVLVHRVPRGTVSRKGYYGQIAVLVVGAIVLQAVQETAATPYQWPVTTMGSFLLLGSAVINLAVAAYHENR
jgi:hypothetical protein